MIRPGFRYVLRGYWQSRLGFGFTRQHWARQRFRVEVSGSRLLKSMNMAKLSPVMTPV